MNLKGISILMAMVLTTLLSGCSYHQYYECPSPQNVLSMQNMHVLPVQTIAITPAPVPPTTEKTTIYRVY
jgi:hypothetical protein